MKKILGILLLFIVFVGCDLINSMRGCPDEVNPPKPTLGIPDDYSWYDSSNVLMYTETYYCQSGRYISLTYTYDNDKCEWELTDRFETSGIC